MYELRFFSFHFLAITSFIFLTICSCDKDSDPVGLPVIDSISPASGFVNTPIVIIGSGFSKVLSENIVTINGIIAEITEATPTYIKAIIPLMAQTGPVKVIVKGKSAENSPTFTVEKPKPVLSKITPEAGLINTEVTITGLNFSTELSDNKIFLGATEVAVKSATSTALTFIVPSTAQTGPVKVVVKGSEADIKPVFAVATLPSLTTQIFSLDTKTTGSGGGNISSDGGSTVTARGICWSSSNLSPDLSDNKTENGTGIGTFSSTITGLIFGQTYYVRAYASNNFGTSYGEVVSFVAVQIGQLWQGGILVYIYKPGDPGYTPGVPHGLIAANSNVVLYDEGTNLARRQFRWTPGFSTETKAKDTEIGTGSSNTAIILNVLKEGNFAAKLCADYYENGFSDWHLPSKDELNKIYLNRDAVGFFDTYYHYWSSSEKSNSTVWVQNFSNGNQYEYDKSAFGNVRPIRRF